MGSQIHHAYGPVTLWYISGDTPAEVFAAAAQWAAENDGGMAIEAMTWSQNYQPGEGEHRFDMGIYVESQS